MVITFIRRFIFMLEKGRLFTTRDCLNFGKRASVDQALCRLVRDGTIVRLARGVFRRNDWNLPHAGAFDVALAKARAFGKTIACHGADLACDLGLVDEGNHEPTFAVDKGSSSFRFGGTVIHLREACLRKMQGGDSKVGQVVRALWYIGRSFCTLELVMKACSRLGRIERKELVSTIARMPAWLGDRFVRC